MNANEFLRNKLVYRLDTSPSPHVRGSGFARLVSNQPMVYMLWLVICYGG